MSRKSDTVLFRPDNLETLRLALELMRRIPHNRKVTAAQLQQQVADIGIVRDIRTIRRQLDLFVEHFGVDRDPTRPIGYSWKERARAISVAAMSEHEALVMLLAEQQLATILPPSAMRAMQGFFEQARRNLHPFGDERLAQQWLSKVRVVSETVKLLPPKIEEGVFETVSQALYANLMLLVRYRNLEGRVSNPQVMPLGLVQQGPRLFLICRYPGEKKFRSLALHRMLLAKATTLGFTPPADFDLKRFDDEGRLVYGNGSLVRLSFRIVRVEGEQLRETPLSTDQVVRDDGDRLRVTATVVDSLALRRWLRSYGDEISDVRMVPLGSGDGSGKGRLVLKRKKAAPV